MKLTTEDYVRIKNQLLFVARELNAIVSIDLDTGSISIRDMIPEKSISSKRVSVKITYWNNKLIFVPMNNDKLWIYNIEEKKWKKIDLKHSENGSDLFIFQAVEYEDRLFILGGLYSNIICLDLEKETITYIENVFQFLKKKYDISKDSYVRCDYVRMENNLYMASCLSNYVLKFDMKYWNYEWIEVGSPSNQYSGITWDGINFWLAPRHDSPVVRWDGEKMFAEYPLPHEFAGKKWSFLGAVYDKKQIVFPGSMNSKTLIFDQTGQYIVDESHYFFYKSEDGYRISQKTDGTLSIIDKENTLVNYICEVSTDSIREFLNKQEINMLNMMIHNSVRVPILELKYGCTDHAKCVESSELCAVKDAGKQIWKTVNSNL